jgi:hypothetical protein
MKKLLIVTGIILVLGLCSLSGCLDEKGKFMGTWQTQDGKTLMTFDSDNTVTISGTGPLGLVALIGTFNYSLANQRITFSSGDLGFTLDYSFPESDQLILSNDQGASLILTKK